MSPGGKNTHQPAHRVVVVFAQTYDFAGGDDERVTGAQRPGSVAQPERAGSVFEVGEHEEVVRVSVIAGRVGDRELV